jgi:hypothetical protein
MKTLSVAGDQESAVSISGSGRNFPDAVRLIRLIRGHNFRSFVESPVFNLSLCPL